MEQETIVKAVMLSGIFVAMCGLVMGKCLDSTQKMLDRGLHHPRKMTLIDQFLIAIQHWDVFVPVMCVITGFMMILFGLVMFLMASLGAQLQ